MRRRTACASLGGVVALLAACGGTPPLPDWQRSAEQAGGAHVESYLAGRDRAAAQELARARRAVRATGLAEAMARVELRACAAEVASLQTGDCPAFAPLAADADAAQRAYAQWLGGHTPAEPTLLPSAQRPLPALTTPAEALAALRAIDAPLSRLLAAALLQRRGLLAAEGRALAIDTAARQGWTRPLLAWLMLDREHRLAAGDTAGAAERQRQIERIGTGPTAGTP